MEWPVTGIAGNELACADRADRNIDRGLPPSRGFRNPAAIGAGNPSLPAQMRGGKEDPNRLAQ